jgi:hypothetical protein
LGAHEKRIARRRGRKSGKPELISSKYPLCMIYIYILSNDFKIDTIALFDTWTNLNCIKEGIVPKLFIQNTFKNLSTANNSKLVIAYKTQASVFNNKIYLKNFFIVTNDINYTIILGTPFIDMITPYKIDHENII